MDSDLELKAADYKKFMALVRRRARHVPVAYLTGHKEFYGLDFLVTEDVLIPRPETELLVEEAKNATSAMGTRGSRLVLADIGTGSGVIAICLAKSLPQANVVAVDRSAKALTVARRNARQLQAKVRFSQGDLLSPIKSRRIDIVVANLPYVDDREKNLLSFGKHAGIKKGLAHEPKLALYGGKFGLEVYGKLFKQITELKYQPQVVICEIGHAYVSQLKKLVKKYFPNRNWEIKKDLAGRNRILKIW